MSARDDGGPAFPVPADVNPDSIQSGMSLRDWFAGQVLMGAIACPKTIINNGENSISKIAYQMADAMLAERAKE